ncbi:MAG: hypothetical protein H7Z73_00530 [Candidatus Saccharibacteria bacterium]|nr:hypothetical protein [Moraxellaceae bacterium]
MNISKKFTRGTMLVVNLTLGMSLQLYAAGPNPDMTPTTSMSVSDAPTTATRIENRHRLLRHQSHHRHHHNQTCHKQHHVAQDINRDSIKTIKNDNKNAERVVWKNGVIYHDINPTGNIKHVPNSTSDTLHGGVTTTHEHQ